jgi:hypothetical protein
MEGDILGHASSMSILRPDLACAITECSVESLFNNLDASDARFRSDVAWK